MTRPLIVKLFLLAKVQSSHGHRGLLKRGSIIHGWSGRGEAGAQRGQLKMEKIWRDVGVKPALSLPPSLLSPSLPPSLFLSLALSLHLSFSPSLSRPPSLSGPEGIRQTAVITQNPLCAFCCALRLQGASLFSLHWLLKELHMPTDIPASRP